MIKRIFPFNPKLNTWRNYSNYLNWVSNDIQSVVDYASYWHPTYSIINNPIEEVGVVGSNIGVSHTDTPEDATSNIDFPIEDIAISDKTYHIIWPTKLARKEGIYASDNNFYLYLDINNTINSGSIGNINSNQHFMHVPMSYIVFPKIWTHQGNQQNSKDLENPNNYFLMAQAFAPIYELTSLQKTLKAKCYDEGPGVLGSILNFSLEVSPSRYFILDKNIKSWESGMDWSVLNWSGDTVIHSSKNTTWNNSYPLMPEIECYREETTDYTQNNNLNNYYEDFFMDYSTSIGARNLDNHAVLSYTIIRQDKDNLNPSNLTDWIYVNVF